MSIHAIDQAWERHGQRISMEDIRRIKRVASTPGSPLAVEMPLTLKGDRAVAVRFLGCWLPVVVGRDGNIVTVLPARCLNPIMHRIEARERELSSRNRTASA